MKSSLSRGFGRWFTRSALLWVISSVGLAIVVFYAAQLLTVSHVAHAQVNVAPYTIKQEQYAYNSQYPNGVPVGNVTVAMRSDGATAYVGDVFGQLGLSSQETYRRLIFPDGRRYLLYDGISSELPMLHYSPEQVAARKEAFVRASSNCVYPNQTLLGYDKIEGYKVAVVKWPPTGKNDTHVLTVWKAPELSCATLQVRTQAPGENGSLTTIAETKTTSVALGEPMANLFEVPSNYAILKPSQIMQKEAVRVGKPWTPNDQATALRDDSGLAQRLAKPN